LNLNPYQVRTLLYLVAAHVDSCVLAGRQPPAAVVQLEAFVKSGGSSSGTDIDCAAEQSDSWNDLIGSAEASLILHCTPRYIRKIAADLDGVKCGNRWLFKHRIVIEYAEARGAGDGRDRSAAGRDSAISP
jgi:hypothetical protein